jgi:hypothetical protein
MPRPSKSAGPALPRWGPALRRAVMTVRPEYFGWPPQVQERYGAALPADDRARFDQALLRELFGRKPRSPTAAARATDRLSPEEQNLYNETVLPLVGIGEDSFFLNEWMDDDRCILDFESLRDFDEHDHRFQEDARASENPAYARRPYRGSLYLTWARLFVDGRFTYATLSMAAGYLSSEIQNRAIESVEQRIPYRYVHGPNHGKRDGDCWQWDMRVRAGGKEALLESLQERVFEYELERNEALLSAWDHLDRRGAYVLDTSIPPERNLHFVFSDTRALAAVRFRSFMRDVRAIARPAAELAQALESETKALDEFVAREHESLLQSSRSSLHRLRPRRRVLIHKDALEDLK